MRSCAWWRRHKKTPRCGVWWMLSGVCLEIAAHAGQGFCPGVPDLPPHLVALETAFIRQGGAAQGVLQAGNGFVVTRALGSV